MISEFIFIIYSIILFVIFAPNVLMKFPKYSTNIQILLFGGMYIVAFSISYIIWSQFVTHPRHIIQHATYPLDFSSGCPPKPSCGKRKKTTSPSPDDDHPDAPSPSDDAPSPNDDMPVVETPSPDDVATTDEVVDDENEYTDPPLADDNLIQDSVDHEESDLLQDSVDHEESDLLQDRVDFGDVTNQVNNYSRSSSASLENAYQLQPYFQQQQAQLSAQQQQSAMQPLQQQQSVMQPLQQQQSMMQPLQQQQSVMQPLQQQSVMQEQQQQSVMQQQQQSVMQQSTNYPMIQNNSSTQRPPFGITDNNPMFRNIPSQNGFYNNSYYDPATALYANNSGIKNTSATKTLTTNRIKSDIKSGDKVIKMDTTGLKVGDTIKISDGVNTDTRTIVSLS